MDPPAKTCAADFEAGAKVPMTCKIPKCIIDKLKRWEWPGIGVNGEAATTETTTATTTEVVTVPDASSTASSLVQLGKTSTRGEEQCVCIAPREGEHESVDAPDPGPDGTAPVPKNAGWICYDDMKK